MNDAPKDVTVSITYRFTTGETQEITADILVKQAGMTLEQAITLCEVLNGMNDTEANQERRETRRHTSLSLFDDDVNPPKPRNQPLSVDELIIMDESMARLLDIIDRELTPKQKQRLIRRIFEGMTLEEIGALESVHFTAVAQSIDYALKKIKKYFL